MGMSIEMITLRVNVDSINDIEKLKRKVKNIMRNPISKTSKETIKPVLINKIIPTITKDKSSNAVEYRIIAITFDNKILLREGGVEYSIIANLFENSLDTISLNIITYINRKSKIEKPTKPLKNK